MLDELGLRAYEDIIMSEGGECPALGGRGGALQSTRPRLCRCRPRLELVEVGRNLVALRRRLNRAPAACENASWVVCVLAAPFNHRNATAVTIPNIL